MGQEQKAQKGLGSLLTLVKFFLQALLAFVWSKIQPKDYYSDNPYLHEGFGPVDDERDDKDLPVRGELPKDLHGQFVRNGPNPRFKPTGPYHWFDGDGMLHGTYIKDGKASYSNKYVRTLRWYEEEEAKSPVFLKLGDLMTPEGIVKLLGRKILEQVGLSKTFKGTGTGNTALTYHDRRLLALHEGDAPYHVVAPSLDTVGRYDYNGKLKTAFTAHPKVDQKTGEMLFFGYDVDKKPYCTYHVVNKEGELVNSLPIDLPAPVMMHDFAITEHYSIIMNLPLIFDTERVLEGKSVLYFDSTVPAKFGLVPRHAKTSEIKWFNATPCFVFHTVNAWEEGDEVVLFACRSAHFHDSFFELPSRKYKSFRDTTSRPFLYQWRFNIKTGEVSERVADNDFSSEFPRVKEDLIGYKTKYAYTARFNYEVNGLPLGDAVIKYDLGDNGKKLGVIEYGPNKFGGECVFVPRHQASSEDDGYLITYVYDQTTNKSELWVMDAKNMNPKPIAVVSISRKVPYGFHGQWISADEIEKQRVSSVA